jgi:hypothetical protein
MSSQILDPTMTTERKIENRDRNDLPADPSG